MEQRHPLPAMSPVAPSAKPTGQPRRMAPASLRATTMPPMQRGAMVPRPWLGVWPSLMQALRTRRQGDPQQPADVTSPAPAWMRAARRRRRLLLLAVVLTSALATVVLSATQSPHQQPLLEGLQTALFALLFAWVAAGCLTAVMGFGVLLRGDQHALSRRSVDDCQPLDPHARTAIIMPICHEDVNTVFAGLRATCESLMATGAGRLFDVFVLSDSSDPDVRYAEMAAWQSLRQSLGFHRIYYRHRVYRTKRKAGNVADFCRRWGRNYRYMVVLDADSVMSGDCLLTLVRLMEAHPQAGILQTVPQTCGHTTLHARAQQFASRVTGRLFAAGMQYWQLGEAHYWGHNAIIRVEPFMRHCALAPLRGRGALSGDILSHDFVEAALMRRAGYHVWLVQDLHGSYEQQPPHLLAELQRDRRWCQGNLQNARLIAEPGLHAVHRAMLATGAMAYLSAPLWLAYVTLGVALWLMNGDAFYLPRSDASLGVIGLWMGTVCMLILPRALGLLTIVLRSEQHQYGGTRKLLQSGATEAALSMLQAPLRMLAHTLFVLGALTGWRLEWRSPPREATDVSWREAAQRYGVSGMLVLGLSALLAATHPDALLWLLPMLAPLLLALPIIVWTSQTRIGEQWRAARLLLVPEESWTPAVLRRAWLYTRRRDRHPAWHLAQA